MFEHLCDYIKSELSEIDRKAKSGKVSTAELEYADTLAHLKKSLLTVDAMEESDGGYSGRYPMMPRYGYTYDDGRSYADGRMEGDGRSYAGRMNAKRDSMGRYARTRGTSYGGNGYSYAEDMEATKDEMRELAQKIPEEHRRKIERALDELR